MKTESFRIDKKDDSVEKKPFLRVALDGNGCGLKGCKCSPNNFISISNGNSGTLVSLTDKEAAMIISDKVVWCRL